MTLRYIFADEAGNFDFSRKPRASRYFIVCTILTNSCDVGHDLLNLRRHLAWNRFPLGEYFHATIDKQVVRDKVFETISRHDFAVQTTIMEKSKAQPQVRTSNARFYKYGWYYHFKHGIRRRIRHQTELMVTAASISTKKNQRVFNRLSAFGPTSPIPKCIRRCLDGNFWKCCKRIRTNGGYPTVCGGPLRDHAGPYYVQLRAGSVELTPQRWERMNE